MPDAASYDAPMLGFFLKKLLAGDVLRPDQTAGIGTDVDLCRSLYLDLMQACLQDRIYEDPSLSPSGIMEEFNPTKRDLGRDMPSHAHTMIGNQRLNNLRVLAEHVVKHGVLHWGVPNMPAAVPRTATLALTNATTPYAVRIANLGLDRAAEQFPDIALGINVRNGEIVHPHVRAAFES